MADSPNDSRLPDLMRDLSVSVEAVQALLGAGANVNGVDHYGHTALMRAFWKDDPLPFVKLFLSRGADVRLGSHNGSTALHFAALGGAAETAWLLIRYGAYVKAQTQTGVTPLHLAAAANHRHTCAVLLGNGADPSVPDKLGRTPMDLAAQNHWPQVVDLLRRHGTRPDFDKDRGDPYAAAKAAALQALREGYPAILAGFGMGDSIYSMDPQLGLPVRLNGDAVPLGGEASARGHRDGVLEFTESKGPAWNSRLQWLDWIVYPWRFFEEQTSQPRVISIKVDGAAGVSPDGHSRISVESHDRPVSTLRLWSNQLFSWRFLGSLSDYRQVMAPGAGAFFRWRPAEGSEEQSRKIYLAPLPLGQWLQLGWGPQDSGLACLRVVNFKYSNDRDPEAYCVLDLGLGARLPSHTGSGL